MGGPFASVVALDAATGATVWKSGSAAASYCSALPITFDGRRQVVVFLQNELAGFDLETGLLLWGRTVLHRLRRTRRRAALRRAVSADHAAVSRRLGPFYS